MNFVEVFEGLAAGSDDGGDYAGFLRLADVMVRVADVDRPVGRDAELLDEADDAKGASPGR